MQGYIAETEDECYEIINMFENTITGLKSYADPFEIIYFCYTGEYGVFMWKFDGAKLMSCGGWIGDYNPDEGEHNDDCIDCNQCESDNNYVDIITEELRSGSASDELRKSLINDLKEYN